MSEGKCPGIMSRGNVCTPSQPAAAATRPYPGGIRSCIMPQMQQVVWPPGAADMVFPRLRARTLLYMAGRGS